MRRASQWFLILAISLGLFLPAAMPAPALAATPTDLFFSEYIEGSSNNKALEIFNGTGAAVDLAAGGYSIQQFSNGSATAGLTINLTGTVADGDVYVLAHSSAVAAILAQADQTSGAGLYNGDDAVVLRKGTTVLDVIGQIGFDPGTQWGVDPVSTADNTLRRKSTVCAGDPIGNDAFDPSVEWDGYAIDTFDGLGAHTATCGGVVADSAPSVASTSPANGDSSFPVGSNITVTFSEPVELTGAWFALSCSVSGSPSGMVTGGPTTFVLDPELNLADGESCTLTIHAAAVTDQDAEDPPDVMEADFVVSFTAYDVCAQPYTAIPAIQGSGLTAAITGVVTTQGVVVGDFEGTASAQGFFIQDPVGDGVPATSDGIFVFTGSSNRVNIGDVVRVTGYARERFTQTTLNGSNSNSSAVPAANIVACGMGSVPPTDVMMPFADANYLERFEGMLVRLPQPLVISEYFNYDRFGEIVLALPLDGESRPFTGTAIDEPGDPANDRTDANSLRRITLDDAVSAQNPSTLRHPDGSVFALDNSFRGGDILQNTVGVLGYDFSLYRIFPTGPAEYTAVNPRTVQPDDVGGNVKVASFNVLNYFTTIDTGPSGWICGPQYDQECRGADTEDELYRQRAKIIAALSAIDADVVGLIEIENHPVDVPTADLVAGLNEVLGAGTYDYVATGAIGMDAIRQALIYKPATVTPVGDYAVLDSLVDGRFLDDYNRPVLAQTFQDNLSGGRVTVAVNHLKSKGSDCNAISDPDTGDGAGNCNLTRTWAAEALVDWLASDPTNTGDGDYLIIGDLNSYDKEDPIDVLLDADYTDLMYKFQGEYAYSYVFDGQIGYLDHALANAGLLQQVTGTTAWHINADEPDVIDYDMTFKPDAQDALFAPDAYRSSDHAPVIVGLNLKPETNDSFVTAGGWIVSPAGAYAADSAATGKAFIPFTLKYKKGALQPTGNLQFQLLGTDLNFRSTSFDWLVINRAGTLAQFKGQGTIGDAAYQFMVWVADGKPDMYRIRIWNGDGVVYDNGALQPLSAGSIQIHVK